MKRTFCLFALLTSAAFAPLLAHAEDGITESIEVEPWGDNCKDGGIKHTKREFDVRDGSEKVVGVRYECIGLSVAKTIKAKPEQCPGGKGVFKHAFPKGYYNISKWILLCEPQVTASVPPSLSSWLGSKPGSGQNGDAFSEALALRRTVDRKPGFTQGNEGAVLDTAGLALPQ